MSDGRRKAIAIVVIVVACAATFGRSVTFDFVNWDDGQYLLENHAVTSPSSASAIDLLATPYLGYPVPVTVATYQLEHALFGMNPVVFHLDNVILHTLAAVFLFLALIRFGTGVRLGAAFALGFALHPLCVEPVCWVSGRKEVLVALFTILAAWSLLGAVRRNGDDVRARLPAAVFLVLACLSKPSMALVPLAFAYLDRRGRPAVWLVVLAFTVAVTAATFFMESSVGAVGSSGGVTDIMTRVAAGAWKHAVILVHPFSLAPKYVDPPGGPGIGSLVLGVMVVVSVLAALAVSIARNHPSWFGLAWAVLTYLPNSGLVNLNRAYADSYAYLPLVGFVLAAGPVAKALLELADQRLRPLAGVAAMVGILALGVTSAARADTFMDGVTLWSSTYRSIPDSPQVCRNLGNAYLFGRRMDPASAVRVYDHCIATLGDRPFYLKNLAIATLLSGDWQGATVLFGEYGRLRPDDRSIDKYVRAIDRAATGKP